MNALLLHFIRVFAGATCPFHPVRLFRLCLGMASTITALEAAIHFHKILQPGMLRLPVWGPALPLPPALAYAFCFLWALSGLCQFLPRFSRAGLALSLPIQIFVLLFDEQLYSNHLYLLAILTAISLFLPAHSNSPSPWWPVFLIQCQISIVYFFAAFSKCNLFFLSGALIWNGLGRWIQELSFARLLFEPPAVFYLAFFSIAAEFFLSFGLWFKRTRPAAILLGIGLHGLMAILLHAEGKLGIIAFCLMNWGAYILFAKARPECSPAAFPGSSDHSFLCFIRRARYENSP